MNQQNMPVGTSCPPCKSAPIYEKPICQSPHATAAGEGLAQGKNASFEHSAPSFWDSVFSLIFIFVGWSYFQLVFDTAPAFFFGSTYLGTLVFTVLFSAAVLFYLYKSGIHPAGESWFWLCILLALGVATALPYSLTVVASLHLLALHWVACYWVLCASGRLADGQRTSNWLVLDLAQGVFLVPFGNFLRLPWALWQGLRQGLKKRSSVSKKPRKKGRAAAVLLGLLLAAGCIALVLPLLFAADAQFARLFDTVFADFRAAFTAFFRNFTFLQHLENLILQSIFYLPISFFLYGLVYGCIHGRRTDILKKEPVQKLQAAARITPQITVSVALFALSFVYLIFIALQANYLFAGFFGALPKGFSYAEYARSGFFELCRIAAINLTILLAANTISRTPLRENPVLRVCNLWLSALTLLLLVTAVSKMGLYIWAYGLTVKRVLASVFLVWIAVVFICVIVQQFRPVPILRIGVFLGAVLFTLLCVLPICNGIRRYNLHFGYSGEEPVSSYSASRTV